MLDSNVKNQIQSYIDEQLNQNDASQTIKQPINYSISFDDIQRVDELLMNRKNTFVEHLFKLIDDSGKTDVQVYTGANISRKLFSKIRSDVTYHPSKPTVIALALSLELDLNDANILLAKAGFALSDSDKVDLIYRYCFENEIYDMKDVNEILFAFNERMLGL